MSVTALTAQQTAVTEGRGSPPGTDLGDGPRRVSETISETPGRAYDRLMSNLIAKIRQWLGLDKKPDDPKH